MLALAPRVVDALWEAFGPQIPEREEPVHPLGCHRPRIADRDVFEAILFRLVTGCSWDVAGRLGRGGETTLRTRYRDWNADGAFDRLAAEAIDGYDRIVGVDLSEALADGSVHKAPCGGEGTGKSPVDRSKLGWKWSLLTDRAGIPVGWAADGANRHDQVLLEPTLAATGRNGLLADVETLHLDRGYAGDPVLETCRSYGIDDVVRAPKRARGRVRRTPETVPLGMRWAVERTNSWLSNFGQLRRSTDRNTKARLGQLALAIAAIITVKLFKWADRWNHP